MANTRFISTEELLRRPMFYRCCKTCGCAFKKCFKKQFRKYLKSRIKALGKGLRFKRGARDRKILYKTCTKSHFVGALNLSIKLEGNLCCHSFVYACPDLVDTLTSIVKLRCARSSTKEPNNWCPQNATPVDETGRGRANATLSRKRCDVLRMRPQSRKQEASA